MSTREIVLDGGSPWGFRMHGGADVGQPLRISRVNPGSKAAQKGVREGDVISSINGQSTRNISNSDAHALLRNAGQTLHLGLNEECSGSPKRRLHRNSQDFKTESTKRSSVNKTSGRTSSKTVNGTADPNCNTQTSVKSSVKESTPVSPQDSKGRRRRRHSTTRCPEDSDAQNQNMTPQENTNVRRRRRSRGGNRRKCRIGIETDISEIEQKLEEARGTSVTETDTDATMSDIAGRNEELEVGSGEQAITNNELDGNKLLVRDGQISVSDLVISTTCGTERTLGPNIPFCESRPMDSEPKDDSLDIAIKVKVEDDVIYDNESVKNNVQGDYQSIESDSTISTVIEDVTGNSLEEMESSNNLSITLDNKRYAMKNVEVSSTYVIHEHSKETNVSPDINKFIESEKSENETDTEINSSNKAVNTSDCVSEEAQLEKCKNNEKVIVSQACDVDNKLTEYVNDYTENISLGDAQETVDRIEEAFNTIYNEKTEMKCVQLQKGKLNVKEIDESFYQTNDRIPEKGEENIGIKDSAINGENLTVVHSEDLNRNEELTTVINENITSTNVSSSSNNISNSSGAETSYCENVTTEVSFSLVNKVANKDENATVMCSEDSCYKELENDSFEENCSITETIALKPLKIQNNNVTDIERKVELENSFKVTPHYLLSKSTERSGRPVTPCKCEENCEGSIPPSFNDDKLQENASELKQNENSANIVSEIFEASANFKNENSHETIILSNNITKVDVIGNLNEKKRSEIENYDEMLNDVDIRSVNPKTDNKTYEEYEFATIKKTCVSELLSQDHSDETEAKDTIAMCKELKEQIEYKINETDKDYKIHFHGENTENAPHNCQPEDSIHLETELNEEGEVISSKHSSVTKTDEELDRIVTQEDDVTLKAISEDNLYKNVDDNIILNKLEQSCSYDASAIENNSKENPQLKSSLTETLISNDKLNKEIICENTPQENMCINLSQFCSTECSAVIVEADIWEEVEEMYENALLSEEDRALLDPEPLMEAQEEESLREFLHSLNLADYSKEAINARASMTPSNSAEELYASRRDKRRACLETYSISHTQQRGLEVIVEENSSDYSDSEKRIQQEKRVRGTAWEEAVYNPETNEVMLISNDSDEGDYEVQNRNHGYSAVVMETFQRTSLIAEETNIDVFSADMENVLENVLVSEEFDSEEGKMTSGDESVVKIELAESSDEDCSLVEAGKCSLAEGSWKRGKARERQDVVEIVYLEEDSGSTSSGSFANLKKTDEAEDEPDVAYESVEFSIVGIDQDEDSRCCISDISKTKQHAEVVYENVEFHKKLANNLNVLDIDACAGGKTLESPSDVYETIEFVQKENSEKTNEQISSSISHEVNKTITNEIKVKDSEENKSNNIQLAHSTIVTNIKCENNNIIINKEKHTSLSATSTEENVSKIQDGDLSKFNVQHKKKQSELSKDDSNVKSVVTKSTQKNVDSQTIDFVKRILALMPEKQEKIENCHLESIISQLKSEDANDGILSVKAIEEDAVNSANSCEKFHHFASDNNKQHEAEDCIDEIDSITPTNRSRRESSSSDAGSHGTAFYCPRGFSPLSSDADISSYADDASIDNRTLRRKHSPYHNNSVSRENISLVPPNNPKTLKDISIGRVLLLPYGSDILHILGFSGKNSDNIDNGPYSLEETVKRFQLLSFPAISAAYTALNKPPFTSWLSDHSYTKQEIVCNESDTSRCTQWLGMPTKEDPNLFIYLSPSQRQSYRETRTPQDADNLLDLHRKFIQRRGYHEKIPPPPPNRKCFDLTNFISSATPRMSKEIKIPAHERSQVQLETSSCENMASPASVITSGDSKILSEGGESGCSRSRSSSRLLAILREAASEPQEFQPEYTNIATSPPPLPPLPHAYQHQLDMVYRDNIPPCLRSTGEGKKERAPSWYGQDITNKERLNVRSLSDWLQLVRSGVCDGVRSQDSTPPASVCMSTQSSPGLSRRVVKQYSNNDGIKEHLKLKHDIIERRFSLPEKQLELVKQNIINSNTTSSYASQNDEVQQTLLSLQQSKVKQTDLLELRQQRRFDAENYTISKKGDIAIINSNKLSKQEEKYSERPKSMPPPPTESLITGGEIFRQQMYMEYMNKVAERKERRRHKVIRLSSAPRDDASDTSHIVEGSATAVHQLESEFMGRVKERMDKLGISNEDEQGESVSGGDNHLPKHLQELLVIAGTDSDVASDVDGVWSPNQKQSTNPTPELTNSKEPEKRREGEDAPPVVWTPKSAGASPTSERKEFRPINFESPTFSRKNKSATSTPIPIKPSEVDDFITSTTATHSTPTFSSVFPPWQQQHSRDDSTISVSSTIHSPTSEKSVASSTITSTLDRRIVQSQSAPPSGLSALASSGSTSNKLPRAQNPTITLLQKAREGQLPRGALYLDHKMNSKEGDKSYISPNEILYSVKKEYESEAENEQRRKIVELGPRKFEGIGPMTKEGIPIVLRSEVKDINQAKWYKRMYESLHRAGKDGHYPYTSPGGYLSEPEPACYDSDIGYSAKYATLDRRRIKNKENDFTTSTLPRSRYVPHPASIKYATEVYKNQPGRIEDYEPGHSSISEKETKQWWDEVLDIFDGWLESHSPHQHHPNYRSSSLMTADAIYHRQASAEPQTTPSTPSNKPFMTYALKESGYESDSTLVFKRRDDNLQSQLSPAEQKIAYKTIQKGGEVPLHGLRKLAPERPKESPHRYVESEVTIHYRSPVRSEAKEVLSEEELARRQAEAMRRIYQEERRRKYLQELQDMHSRRHTDNFTPSQKSPIPLNRYDDFFDDVGNKGKSRDRTPEPKLVARALYNFVGQTSRELSFRRGDIIFVKRQVDKNWYEGEHNAMVGLFPFNYVEIIPYDGIRTIPKRPSEGQARAKFNFIAQTHLELSLVKGELVVLTRRVDDNWFEGRIGNRKGIFPVSYVEILSEPGEKPVTPVITPTKPITLPASHTVLMNGSGIKQSMGQHGYQPSYFSQNKLTSSYTSSNPYATLPRHSQISKQPLAPMNQTLHIDTHSEPVAYRALYNYRPQNEDELELCEGDTVYVMEKCDDGWYVGSSQRTGYFGTFPGNYVERI